MLRNSYYKYPNYKTANRKSSRSNRLELECRFIDYLKSENFWWNENFTVELEDGFYRSELNSNIELNLVKATYSSENGFEVYKIDGRYVVEGDYFKFLNCK